jgi:hypothetical protein
VSNTLSTYNPIFYAQEAILALHKALGMAARVYRGYDDSQSSRQYGDTISIRRPGVFTAQNAPSTAQAITASSIDLKLDQHKEVKFTLTDKELAYTSQRIIEEHITPAAYALADQIDQSLAGLYTGVPWITDFTAPAVVPDITAARARMFKNLVPQDNPAMLHAMVTGDVEGELLNIAAFTQHQGSGEAGVTAQMRGYLGSRYGINFFANQNVATHTSATVADVAGAINNGAGYAKGATTINFDGVTAAAEFKKGDVLTITGHTQRYVLTADFTASSGAVTGATIEPGLEAAVVDDQVVTVTLSGGSGTTKAQNLFFHRDAFALGMARLPDFMDGQGVRVFSIADPVTNLSLRARTWADGDASSFYVALDCLYGFRVLDGNKAVRVRSAA